MDENQLFRQQHEFSQEQIKTKKIRAFFRGGITRLREEVLTEMKLDDAGLYMISDANDSETTANKICALPGLPRTRVTITDGCAGGGGNLLQFIYHKKVRNVVAIEKDRDRFNNVLTNNLSVARANVSAQLRNTASEPDCRCTDYFSQIHSQRQDVVFFDPPWGGKYYSSHTQVALFLGDRHMAEIVVDLYRNSRKTGTKYVVIKACNNFAVGDMQEMLGELSAGFAQIEKKDRVKILHRTYNSRKLQKYVVYYIEFPQLSKVDEATEIYDPQYRPIARDKCRIYIEVNDVISMLKYSGTFYLEQDPSNDQSVLTVLQYQWNNRSSDHVPIVLNIVEQKRKDLSYLGNKVGYLEMDSRVDIEHFKSLPSHQVKKLDTYSETDQIHISSSECYSKSIEFLQKCQHKNQQWIDELQKNNKMLLVYVVGLDQYPMIMTAETVNEGSNSQNKFCLHTLSEENKFKGETHYQLADTRQLFKELTQKFQEKLATADIARIRQVQILLSSLECITKVIARKDLEEKFQQNANKIITELKDKFTKSPDEIQKYRKLLEERPTVKASAGTEIDENLTQIDPILKEILLGLLKDLDEKIAKIEEMKQSEAARSSTEEPVPAHKPKQKKQKAYHKRKSFHQFSSEQLFKDFRKFHELGKKMSRFLTMSIKEQIIIVQKTKLQKKYIPAWTSQFVAFGSQLACQSIHNPNLYTIMKTDYPDIYDPDKINQYNILDEKKIYFERNLENALCYQLVLLHEVFFRRWHMVLCFLLNSDTTFEAKIENTCSVYEKPKDFTNSLKANSLNGDKAKIPEKKITMNLQDIIRSENQRYVAVKCKEFMQTSFGWKMDLIVHVGDRMVFFESELLSSADINTLVVDSYTRSYLKQNDGNTNKFRKVLVNFCKSMYCIIFDMMLSSDYLPVNTKTHDDLFIGSYDKEQIDQEELEQQAPKTYKMQYSQYETFKELYGVEPIEPTEAPVSHDALQQKLKTMMLKKQYTFVHYLQRILQLLLSAGNPLDKQRVSWRNARQIADNVSAWMARSMHQSTHANRFWDMIHKDEKVPTLYSENGRVITHFHKVYPDWSLSSEISVPEYKLRREISRWLFEKENQDSTFFKKHAKLQAARKFRSFGLCWQRVPYGQEPLADELSQLVREILPQTNSTKETPEHYYKRQYDLLQLGLLVVESEKSGLELKNLVQKNGDVRIYYDDDKKYYKMHASFLEEMREIYERREYFRFDDKGKQQKHKIPEKLREILKTRDVLTHHEWRLHGKDIMDKINKNQAVNARLKRKDALNICLDDEQNGCYYLPRLFQLERNIIPLSAATLLHVLPNGESESADFFETSQYDSYFSSDFVLKFSSDDNSKSKAQKMQEEQEIANFLAYLEAEVRWALQQREDSVAMKERCEVFVHDLIGDEEINGIGREALLEKIEFRANLLLNQLKQAIFQLVTNMPTDFDYRDFDLEYLKKHLFTHTETKKYKEIVEHYILRSGKVFRNYKVQNEESLISDISKAKQRLSKLEQHFENFSKDLNHFCIKVEVQRYKGQIIQSTELDYFLDLCMDLILDEVLIQDQTYYLQKLQQLLLKVKFPHLLAQFWRDNFNEDYDTMIDKTSQEEFEQMYLEITDKNDQAALQTTVWNFLNSKYPDMVEQKGLEIIQQKDIVDYVYEDQQNLQHAENSENGGGEVTETTQQEPDGFRNPNTNPAQTKAKNLTEISQEDTNTVPATEPTHADDFEKGGDVETAENTQTTPGKNVQADSLAKIALNNELRKQIDDLLGQEVAKKFLVEQLENIVSIIQDNNLRSEDDLNAYFMKTAQTPPPYKNKYLKKKQRKDTEEHVDENHKHAPPEPDTKTSLTAETISAAQTNANNLQNKANELQKDIKYWSSDRIDEYTKQKGNIAKDIAALRKSQKIIQDNNPPPDYAQMREDALRKINGALTKLYRTEDEMEKKIKELEESASKPKQNPTDFADAAKKDTAKVTEIIHENNIDDNVHKDKKNLQYAEDSANGGSAKQAPENIQKKIQNQEQEIIRLQSQISNYQTQKTEKQRSRKQQNKDKQIQEFDDKIKECSNKIATLQESNFSLEKQLKKLSNPYSEVQFLGNDLTKLTRFIPLEGVQRKYQQKYEQESSTWLKEYKKFFATDMNHQNQIVDVNPDGMCLFYCLSFLMNLFGKTEIFTGQTMRQLIIDYESKKHSTTPENGQFEIRPGTEAFQDGDYYAFAFENVPKKDFEDHLDALKADPTVYGELTEIQCFVEIFDMTIIVESDLQRNITAKPDVIEAKSRNAKKCRLVNNGKHYAVILTHDEIEQMKQKAMQPGSFLHRKHIKQYIQQDNDNIWYYDDIWEEKSMSVEKESDEGKSSANRSINEPH